MKNFKKKIELCRLDFTTYVTILIDLGSFLRGVSFDKQSYLDHLKTIDHIVIDRCSLVDAFEQQYKK